MIDRIERQRAAFIGKVPHGMNVQSAPAPLIILDVQDAIDQPVWNGKNNPGYLAAIQRLLAHWRRSSWPVIHIKHDEPTPTSSYHTNGPWNGFKKEVAPISGEAIIIKQQNCAFIGTELDTVLKGMQADRMVLTGVVIHNSMDATVRVGKALGYNIILPSDSTTAVPVVGPDGKFWDAATVQDLTLAILSGEYAEVLTSDDVIARFTHSEPSES
ncbi:MAG: isochorismatase family protein [Hyphomonadaceae bacterium]|nr:isochorismatase family protein [Hyphomonadaceae bacterium]